MYYTYYFPAGLCKISFDVAVKTARKKKSISTAIRKVENDACE